jgi:HSP20 family molecular chaperone IbpA
MIPGNFYIDDNEYDVSAVAKGGKVDKKKIEQWEKKYEEMSVGKPFKVSVPVDVEDAEDAYKAVLKHAGASKKRDDVDTRIVKEVKTGKATYKGGVTGLPGIIDSEEDVL